MSDLSRLADDLLRAGATIGEAVRPALQSSAKAIQSEWQNTWPWSGSKHLPRAGRSPMNIRYETTAGVIQSDAQVFVAFKGQGKLAHLIEYGSPTSGPHPGGAPALAKQAPIFAAEMALIATALLGRGATTSVSTR